MEDGTIQTCGKGCDIEIYFLRLTFCINFICFFSSPGDIYKDKLSKVKFSSIIWTKDGKGVFYGVKMIFFVCVFEPHIIEEVEKLGGFYFTNFIYHNCRGTLIKQEKEMDLKMILIKTVNCTTMHLELNNVKISW